MTFRLHTSLPGQVMIIRSLFAKLQSPTNTMQAARREIVSCPTQQKMTLTTPHFISQCHVKNTITYNHHIWVKPQPTISP
ncbi:hypothetical protein R3I94_015700 [Phoxinus phoxinus]